MNVYVAGKWSRRQEAAQVMGLFREHGYDITHDWTHEDPVVNDTGYWAMCAASDVDAVLNADVMVLLHDPACRGAFVEFGIALAHGVKVIVVDGLPEVRHPGQNCPIFYYLPEVQHVATANDALSAVDALRELV